MAILSSDNTRILNNYDRFTGTPFNSKIVTVWADGTPMSDAKVDNTIYFKNRPELGGGYSKREFDGQIDVRWFGSKGDGITDDQQAFQKATTALKVLGGGVLYVPDGTYIFDPTKKSSSNSLGCVEIYSNTTVQLSRGAVIKIKANGLVGYVAFAFKNALNSSLLGGKIVGDRYEHDYSAAGTHEGGHGVSFEGETINCSVIGTELCNLTGDGIVNSPLFNYVSTISEANLEAGSFDANGVASVDATRLRTTAFTSLTSTLVASRGYFGIYGAGYGGYGGLDNKYYDALFYDSNGTFIKQFKQLKMYERVYYPSNATQVKFVFYKPAITTTFVIQFRPEDYSQNITVERCKIHDNRRQGISVTGCQGYNIHNNDFYNIGGPAGVGQVAKAAGTDPQGGIDVEDGYQLNQNIIITNNRFWNNTGYNIVMITSINVTVSNNFLSSDVNNIKYVSFQCGPGVENLIVANNNFEKGGIILGGDINFTNNRTNELIISSSGESVANNIFLGDNSFKNTRLRIQNSAIKQNSNKYISTPNNVKTDYLLTFESSTEMLNSSVVGDGTIAGVNYSNGSVELKPSIIDGCDFFSSKTANVFPVPFGSVSNTKFRGGLGVLMFRGLTTDVAKFSDCYFEGYVQVSNDLKVLILSGCTFNPTAALSFSYQSLIRTFAGFTGTIIIDNCTFIFTSSATNFNVLTFNLGGTGTLIFTNNKIVGNSKPVGLKTTDSTSTSPFIIKNNSFGGTTKLLRAIDINEGNGDATGVFTVTGSAQTTISIPHGLGVIPVSYSADALSAAAITAGISSITVTATNIIIGVTTPNTGGSLVYSWSAKI